MYIYIVMRHKSEVLQNQFMSTKNETIKKESIGLRGGIAAAIESGVDHFEERELQLLKFHGSYQQDDRDVRRERRKAGQSKAWQFMVRSKIPGGLLSSEQYLAHENMSNELSNGTLRFTNRQGIQMHGVLAGSLKECIRTINTSGLTTYGACGDIVRNTMACAVPVDDPAILDARKLAREISETFYARSLGYTEIWLDGKKAPLQEEEINDPIYGDSYLPRKFKIGIAVPPYNDVDVLTHDTGLVADVRNNRIAGFDVYVGGGMGMSFGNKQTHPSLGTPLFYVPRNQIIDTLKAIVKTQRDFGRRDDRKQARLKYLIRDRGIAWFRNEVVARLSFAPTPHQSIPVGAVDDLLGWHRQAEGLSFFGLWVPDGRIADTAFGKYKSALKQICEQFAPALCITPNANLYFHGIADAAKSEIEAILKQHKIPDARHFSRARRSSHACVSLPTCGLALAESERVFQGVMESLDSLLALLGIHEEPLLVRMSGCPNGCARPYNADIAFVGKGPGKYSIFVGGSYRGDRLARLWNKAVPLEDLIKTIRPLLEEFVLQRRPGEPFSDYWQRSYPAASTDSDSFHAEFEPEAPSIAATR